MVSNMVIQSVDHCTGGADHTSLVVITEQHHMVRSCHSGETSSIIIKSREEKIILETTQMLIPGYIRQMRNR